MSDGDVTVTVRDLNRMRTTPADIAEAMRLYDARRREDVATQSAQERLVLGVFGSWFKRRWGYVLAVSGFIGTVGAGAIKGWEAIQEKAEAQVLERQATQAQVKAVQQTTAAVNDVTYKQDELGRRVEKVEKQVGAQSQITEILLELQLRDPRTQRLLAGDKKLKEKVEKIPGVKVD